MTIAIPDNDDQRPPAVIDGEIVPADAAAPARQRRIIDATVTVRRQSVAVITTAAGHPRTRASVAAGLTVAQGFESWTKRAWDGSTMGTYRRAIRAAEAGGDRQALAEWVDRKERAALMRHKRLMDAPKLAFGVVKAAGGALVGLVALVLVLALVAQLSGVGSFLGVLSGVLALIGFVAAVVAFLWTPLLAALPAFVLLAAYREGKRRGKAPAWAATSADADVDVTIDETTIAAALAALRIPQISDYLKAGTPLQFITPARVDGRGTHAVIRLPIGVPAEKIAKRRLDLSTGLHRQAKEVWPTTGSEAGILDLWVADKGALAEGAGRYPLLDGGLTDVFKGVPAGKSLRGAPVTAPLMERNTITGGQPGQGKSASARVLMIGAALDPTAELQIFVPDTNFDFEVFKPRCSRYVMGAEDEKIAEILAHLRDLHAEVQRRGERLVAHETAAVTRELANRGIGLHPLVVLLEEAHVAIQHKDHGKEIAQLLVDIVKLGRKRAIHVIVSTQAPTKDSMPRDVTRNCSNGIAFAVGDHVANDGLLGQGAYRAGHRATELIPGTDRGTAVVKGFTGARSEILQWYFLSVDEGNDDVTPLIERSLDAIARRGKGLPGAGRPAPVVERVDHLADIADALAGDKRVRTTDLLARLHERNLTVYGSWGPRELATCLEAAGVRPVSVKGYPTVRAEDVHEAIADRTLAEADARTNTESDTDGDDED
ncbi:cell division protein FtsK [Pseudonocardia sichuanensis]